MKTIMSTTALALVVGLAGAPALAQSGDIGPCDTNYSKIDRNDDGAVSAEEAKAAADEQFGRLDADGNGEVSRAEWRSCGEIVMFKDAIGGGSIEQQASGETQSSGSDNQETAAAADSSPFAEGDLFGGRDFDAIDRDGSGDIEIDEALQAYIPETGEQADMSAPDGGVDAQQTASADGEIVDDSQSAQAPGDSADADQQGADVTTGSVATGEMADSASEEDRARDLGQTFSRLDEDDNRRIEKSEWSSRDQSRAAIRFDSLDTDGDDRLTREEWTEQRDTAFQEAEQQAAGEPVTIWRYYLFM